MCNRMSCKPTWLCWTWEMQGSCGLFSSCRHDGLIILATNRPYDLDEAMHRRIMIAIEFRQPDHLLRKAIWQSHMPEQMKLGDDIDLVSQQANKQTNFYHSVELPLLAWWHLMCSMVIDTCCYSTSNEITLRED